MEIFCVQASDDVVIGCILFPSHSNPQFSKAFDPWAGPCKICSAPNLCVDIEQTSNALSHQIRAAERTITKCDLHFFLVRRKQIEADDARAWAATISFTGVPVEFLGRHFLLLIGERSVSCSPSTTVIYVCRSQAKVDYLYDEQT